MENLKNRNAFTMLELVVVIGVSLIISLMILAKYPAFNEQLDVHASAEKIASSVRQAQAYGLGVKEFGSGSNVFPGYGVYFQKDKPDYYYIFADKDKDFYYNHPSERVNQVYVVTTTLQRSVKIYDLCANEKQGGGTCDLVKLRVVYLRPNPQVSLTSEVCSYPCSYSDVEIKIKGPRGSTKTIVIWQSGQVSIE